VDVSLIICTRDGCHRLARCLEAVRHITFNRPWELIIVDNGSTDDTAAVVREFIKTTNVRAIYLFEPTPGKTNGLNTALETATGEILAFTDDDCYPAPDFLSQVWSAFVGPSVGYIGGRIMCDPADQPITVNESMTTVIFPAKSFVCAGCIQGANMALSTKGSPRHRRIRSGIFRFGLTAHSPSFRISRRTRRRPTGIPSRNSATWSRRLP
jgi:glycosyltransferase involved in cell wall biosynthesis